MKSVVVGMVFFALTARAGRVFAQEEISMVPSPPVSAVGIKNCCPPIRRMQIFATAHLRGGRQVFRRTNAVVVGVTRRQLRQAVFAAEKSAEQYTNAKLMMLAKRDRFYTDRAFRLAIRASATNTDTKLRRYSDNVVIPLAVRTQNQFDEMGNHFVKLEHRDRARGKYIDLAHSDAVWALWLAGIGILLAIVAGLIALFKR